MTDDYTVRLTHLVRALRRGRQTRWYRRDAADFIEELAAENARLKREISDLLSIADPDLLCAPILREIAEDKTDTNAVAFITEVTNGWETREH